MWFDTHAHLNDNQFRDDFDLVLTRAAAAKVERIAVIGIDLASSRAAIELAQQHDALRAVVGLQPNSLNEVAPSDWNEIARLASDERVVAIGETGLDRYWKTVPFDVQQDYFTRHLALAAERDLPVVIHCREAEGDVLESLRRFAGETGRPITGVMHSFTGDGETARTCVELGLYISFAGMVTYKKNAALRDVAKSVPLDRLLVETDSPYLSPEPLRGRRNEPANVVHTGRVLAEARGISANELAAATTSNARRLFRI